MKATKLKLAIVAENWRHREFAAKVNRRLPPNEYISELDVTKFVTDRKKPTALQARVIARTLRISTVGLFSGGS